jgi:sulfofructosephosphate aldolase
MPDLTRPHLAAGLAGLARPSGGFAMLALDQRESLRAMFAEQTGGPVTDEVLTRFKVDATRVLSPHASAVLLDRQFALDTVLAEGVIGPGCGLIAAADEFTAGPGEIVAESAIDRAVVPADMRAAGAAALKLLLIWRPDEDPGRRLATVAEFTGMCRTAGLVSILEPVSRAPRDGRPWDWDAGVLAAARELGSAGADLYKAEVPLHAQGGDAEIRRRCEQLTELIASPWVVLSSGVPPEEFPRAVALACQSGASGFLAGRAVWRNVVGRADLDEALRAVAVPALRRLADVVDEHVRGRP